MTDKEQRIEIFCDADARAAMEPEELANCPTVEEAKELMRGAEEL